MHVVVATDGRGFNPQGLRNFLHRRLEIPLLVRALRLPSGCDVLETGCGAGIGLTGLAETCHRASLTGVDIDHNLLGQARGLAVTLVSGDARELPFHDESFDLVVDFGTLYHVQPAQKAIRDRACATGRWPAGT